MNARENFLEAVRFGSPEHVPLANEGIWHSLQFAGNFHMENWTDLWGVTWQIGIEGTVPFPRGNPLPSLDRLDDFAFPSAGDLLFTDQMRRALATVDRGEKLIQGDLTYLLFERAWAVMGMDNFLTAFVTHPAEMHEFLHRIACFARGVFDRYLELGVDGVGFSEDLGSQRALMVSPAMFREFILPEYRYCFENVLGQGAMVNFHSCGCVEDVAADLAGLGVTILNPVQARANNLARVKSETNGRMALAGAIDTAVLARGTPEDVCSEVSRVMGVLKPGGGYICGPDQAIPGIPERNMATLWEAARELGRY